MGYTFHDTRNIVIGATSLLYSNHGRIVGSKERMLQLTPKEALLFQAFLQGFKQVFYTPDELAIIGYRREAVLLELTQSSLRGLRRHISRLGSKLSVFGLKLKWCDDGYLLFVEYDTDANKQCHTVDESSWLPQALHRRFETSSSYQTKRIGDPSYINQ
ncbi:MAG: hypothetical protein J2P37_23250 [Ktedonobacteraceae bacterium]|nr:hypothetical protein [Ktedonobacteraceae bacterium]